MEDRVHHFLIAASKLPRDLIQAANSRQHLGRHKEKKQASERQQEKKKKNKSRFVEKRQVAPAEDSQLELISKVI